MNSQVSGFITSKFEEIQSRIPITLSGFSKTDKASFQKMLDDNIEVFNDNASRDNKSIAANAANAANAAMSSTNNLYTGLEISNPIIFPMILPAPPEPTPEQKEADEILDEDRGLDPDENSVGSRIYGYYDEFGNYNEYVYDGEYGYYNGNLFDDLNKFDVSADSNLDKNITYLNRYGDEEIQEKIQNEIALASMRYGVDENLIKAVIMQESSFSPTSLSSAGAQGLMQLMPATSQELGITNPWDIEQNIDGGTRLLSKYLKDYDGNLKLVLAAYNAGPGAVRKYGGTPPYSETQDYIQKVIAYYNRYHNESPSLYDTSVIEPIEDTVKKDTAPATSAVKDSAPVNSAENDTGSGTSAVKDSVPGNSAVKDSAPVNSVGNDIVEGVSVIEDAVAGGSVTEDAAAGGSATEGAAARGSVTEDVTPGVSVKVDTVKKDSAPVNSVGSDIAEGVSVIEGAVTGGSATEDAAARGSVTEYSVE